MKLKKSLILILINLIAIFSLSAEARESGNLGYNITWEIDYDDCLTILGTGDIGNYYSPPFEKYKYDIQKVVIKSGITSIGNCVFKKCGYVETVELPDNVTKIGNKAFEDCDYLKSINIPDSVTEIGEYAFSGCGSLEEIYIPEGITEIKEGTFNGCYSLEDVKLPESVTVIDDCYFEWCENLKSINIPSNLKKIGMSALLGCKNLSFNIDVGENLTEIDPLAFLLTNIKISSIDENNPNYTLYKGDVYKKDKSEILIAMDKKSTKFQLVKSVIKIGPKAFALCSFENVVIPETVTEIGEAAFQECQALKTVEIPGSVKIIQSNAFSRSETLETVVIKEGVCELSEDSFFGCDNLKSLTIPETLTKISKGAFYGCTPSEINVAGNNSWNFNYWGDDYTGIELNGETLSKYDSADWQR